MSVADTEHLGREWAELERRLGVRVPAPGPGPLGTLEDRATARRTREAALDRWEELQQGAVQPRRPRATCYSRDMAISRARADYEYVVYPSTRVEGPGIKIVPSRIGDKQSLDDAKAVARQAPGSGIYSVSRGRFIGWINHAGRYSSTSRRR